MKKHTKQSIQVSSGYVSGSFRRVTQWVMENSLWYFSLKGGCCADDVLSTEGARYDLERFGCQSQTDPINADLLIVSGAIPYKAIDSLMAVYQQMRDPKYVMAVGACACSGGLFIPEKSYIVVPGVDRVLPVDVYVPGCPPRPEALMNGLMLLQEKIRGTNRDHFEN